jgi:hypothetical protein
MCKKKKPATIMVFHGSAQDMAQTQENTVKVVEQAKVEGREVVQFGGPGSSDRAVRRPPGNEAEEPQFPFDYAAMITAGELLGAGSRDIVEEGVAELVARVARGEAIHMIGFSRGAVNACRTLVAAQKYVTGKTVDVTLDALDPVPGPTGIGTIVLPPFLKELRVVLSKHEGRPGFGHLNLFVGSQTRFLSDVCIGVHGDIGGSTQSALANLNLAALLKRAGLSSPFTPADLEGLALSALVSCDVYSDKWKFTTRKFKDEVGQWTPSSRADIEVPCNLAWPLYRSSLPGALLTQPVAPVVNDRALELLEARLRRTSRDDMDRLMERLERRATSPTTLMTNPPPRVQGGQVYVPRPISWKLPVLPSKSAEVVKKVARKLGPAIVTKRVG